MKYHFRGIYALKKNFKTRTIGEKFHSSYYLAKAKRTQASGTISLVISCVSACFVHFPGDRASVEGGIVG